MILHMDFNKLTSKYSLLLSIFNFFESSEEVLTIEIIIYKSVNELSNLIILNFIINFVLNTVLFKLVFQFLKLSVIVTESLVQFGGDIPSVSTAGKG